MKKFVIAIAIHVVLGLTVVGLQAQGSPRAFFVSPTGLAAGTGAIDSPWDLRTALNHPPAVRPGDVIWVRGGTYRGTFVSRLTGTASLPIIVRSYLRERATIDANPSNYATATLFVNGAYTWYWGLEIMNSDPMRRNAVGGSWPTDLKRGIGVEVHGPETRFINLIVHDNTNGLSLWIDAVNAEVSGNIIFNNGWNSTDRSHGHGIYTQNRTGVRRLTDNLVFNQFGYGLHAYGSDAAYLDNIRMEGNTVFNSGSPEGTYYSANILIGGGKIAANPVALHNATYYMTGMRRGGENNFGYSVGCSNLQVRDNYFSHIGAYPIVLANCTGAVTNNRLFGFVNDQFKSAFPSNTYSTTPTGTFVQIRPNQYEAGRAHITIFNWSHQPSVAVDLSAAGMPVGSEFRIHDAQNFYGAPVLQGTYAGGTVEIPMTVGTVTQPIGTGFSAIPHTGPTFGAFVLMQENGASEPPPPPATCETDPTLCPPPPTCETDPTLCPPPPTPTCETDPTLCPPPPPPPTGKPVASIAVGDGDASEAGLNPGTFVISRTGNLNAMLVVNYHIGGTATEYGDYQTIGGTVRIPAGASFLVVHVIPKSDVRVDPNETVILTLLQRSLYDIGAQKSALLVIR